MTCKVVPVIDGYCFAIAEYSKDFAKSPNDKGKNNNTAKYIERGWRLHVIPPYPPKKVDNVQMIRNIVLAKSILIVMEDKDDDEEEGIVGGSETICLVQH